MKTSDFIKKIQADRKRRLAEEQKIDEEMDEFLRNMCNKGLVSDVEPDGIPPEEHDVWYCQNCHSIITKEEVLKPCLSCGCQGFVIQYD